MGGGAINWLILKSGCTSNRRFTLALVSCSRSSFTNVTVRHIRAMLNPAFACTARPAAIAASSYRPAKKVAPGEADVRPED